MSKVSTTSASRPQHDPWRYQSVIVENERAADGRITRVGTVFLTGRECAWKCVMCDLWRYTTEADTPRGAIPAQIAAARGALAAGGVTQLKLYNASSFFDPRAVPLRDYDDIAKHLRGLERVIVESHPALIGPGVDRLLDALSRSCVPPAMPAALEVAMGLETAHPQALERLHKRMTLDMFATAAARLADRGVARRVFLLIWPPFIAQHDQDRWLASSVEYALSCGAGVVSLIPTRSGNGALEPVAAQGLFHPPRLVDIERSFELALTAARGRARIFVDVWDLERFSRCSDCYSERHARLHAMNLEQRVLPSHEPHGHCADRAH